VPATRKVSIIASTRTVAVLVAPAEFEGLNKKKNYAREERRNVYPVPAAAVVDVCRVNEENESEAR
jgi:hypothetical protein